MCFYRILICFFVAAASYENHENRDCLAVAVLTHGKDDKLCGVDGIIPIDSFIGPIKSCSSLEGKPKIFLFQVVCFNESFEQLTSLLLIITVF